MRYQSNHVNSQDPGTNYDPSHLTENGFGVMGPGSGTVQSQNLERVIRLSDKKLPIHTYYKRKSSNKLIINSISFEVLRIFFSCYILTSLPNIGYHEKNTNFLITQSKLLSL